MTASRTRSAFLGAMLALALLVLPLGAAQAAVVTIVNNDGAGEGFNDNNARSPVMNNPGTTVGQQRLNVFRAAANAWGAILDSNVEIIVNAEMNSLFCSATSALLGQAGPENFTRNFDNAPFANTWYPYALANSIAGSDIDPGDGDIGAEFNTLDGAGCGFSWDYSIPSSAVAATVGGPSGGGSTSFYGTVFHELAHGLGFITLVNTATGARAQGRNDIFMRFLEDHSTGRQWPNMTDSQRATSAIDTGDLHWTGANAGADGGSLTDGRHPSGHLQMYAPNPLEQGSSVAHWDIALNPNEIMEPFDTANPQNIVTTGLFEDIGWLILQGPTGPCVEDATTLCLNNGRFKVDVTWKKPDGVTGDGMAVPFTSDSGLLWFFSSNNIEMLIKVLNGCGLNQRYWVFFAATTNVEFTVTVTDTDTGSVRVYTNTQGQAANAVTDTSAFATCPSPPPTSAGQFTSVGESASELEVAAMVEREMAQAESLLASFGDGPLLAVPASGPFATKTDNGPISVRPFSTVRVTGSGSLGPDGSRYEPAPYIGANVDGDPDIELFTLQTGSGDNVVTFDGTRENLRSFGAGLGLVGRPRINETITTVSSLRTSSSGNVAAEMVLDMTLTGGATDLFPDGFVSPGSAISLTDGGFVIGFFQGTNPLDFPNSGVQSARIELFVGNRRVNNFNLNVRDFFGTGPWGGGLGVTFANAAGQGITRMLTTIVVLTPGGPEPVDPFTCVPDAETLCLNDNRFQVRVDWRDFENKTGPGMKVDVPVASAARTGDGPLGGGTGPDSGTFYFFDEENIEMLIKVLDGCGLNNNLWVFFAATTTVEFTVEVIDSQTGQVKEYVNTLGQAADAVTDTSAFATCP